MSNALDWRMARGFGNPRYSRLGSLRYNKNLRYNGAHPALLQRQSSGRAQSPAVTGLWRM